MRGHVSPSRLPVWRDRRLGYKAVGEQGCGNAPGGRPYLKQTPAPGVEEPVQWRARANFLFTWMHRIFAGNGGGRARGQTEACQREFVGFRRSGWPDSPTTAPSGGPHPGARASRPHALPLRHRSVSLRCGTRPLCRRVRHGLGRSRVPAPLPVEPGGGDGRGCANNCAGGTPALPGGLHPLTSSHQRSSIGIRVHGCSLVVRASCKIRSGAGHCAGKPEVLPFSISGATG